MDTASENASKILAVGSDEVESGTAVINGLALEPSLPLSTTSDFGSCRKNDHSDTRTLLKKVVNKLQEWFVCIMQCYL